MPNKSKKSVTKGDEDILFPEVTIGGIIVRPWSFGMLFEISGYLEEVLRKVESSGLDKELAYTNIKYTTLVRLFTIASKPILTVMSLTTGKTEDEIRQLGMEDGIHIATTIYSQNKSTIMNSLKNVFSPPDLDVEEEMEGQS